MSHHESSSSLHQLLAVVKANMAGGIYYLVDDLYIVVYVSVWLLMIIVRFRPAVRLKQFMLGWSQSSVDGQAADLLSVAIVPLLLIWPSWADKENLIPCCLPPLTTANGPFIYCLFLD
jgi:hypothetical protein